MRRMIRETPGRVPCVWTFVVYMCAITEYPYRLSAYQNSDVYETMKNAVVGVWSQMSGRGFCGATRLRDA